MLQDSLVRMVELVSRYLIASLSVINNQGHEISPRFNSIERSRNHD